MDALRNAYASLQSAMEILSSDKDLAQDPRLNSVYAKLTAFADDFTSTVSAVVKERALVPTDFPKEVSDALAYYGLTIEDVIDKKFTSDIGTVHVRGIYREIENHRGNSEEELIGHVVSYVNGADSCTLINTSSPSPITNLKPEHVDNARGLLLALFHQTAYVKFDAFTAKIGELKESESLVTLLTGHLLVFTDKDGAVVHRHKADKVRVYIASERGKELADRCHLALSTGLFVLRDDKGVMHEPSSTFTDATKTVLAKTLSMHVKCIGEARVPPFLKQ